MTRLAFIWIIFSVGFALWFHSHEEAQRRSEISQATKSALEVGIRSGCMSNNNIRADVIKEAQLLHPGSRITLQPAQNCEDAVRDVIKNYEYHASE